MDTTDTSLEDSEFNSSVTCDVHGEQVGGIVCDHLLTGIGKGFFEPEEPRLEELQAWCAECESLYFEEQDVTEKFLEFSQLRIACAVCFETIRKRNYLRLVR